MKRVGFWLVAVMLIIVLCSCGAKNINDGMLSNSSMKAIGQSTSAGYSLNMSDYDGSELYSYDYITPTTYKDPGGENLLANKKIIKNANIDVEVTGAKEAYNAILAWAKENGGYEFSQTLSVNDGNNVINATIKISPQKLDEFLAFIATAGDVINSHVSSEDITDAYFDANVRLETKRESLAAYYKILSEAKTVDEIVRVQTTIDNITAEIESMQGKLDLWDKQVSESTVTIYMREKSDSIKIKKEINWSALSFEDMGYLIKYGFISVWNKIVLFIQWAAIIAVSIIPLLLIAGIIIVLIRFKNRRKHK